MEILTSSLTLASHKAHANLQANLLALWETQPWVNTATLSIPDNVEWVLGRDGQLTARVADSWYAGCSIPQLAGDQMMRDLLLDSPTGCLLRPMHACHIRILLGKLRRQQALLIVQENPLDAALLLACEDLSRPLGEHRLWLGLGPDWRLHFERALEQMPGLPIPGQYVRTQHLPAESFDSAMAAANVVFGKAMRFRQGLAKRHEGPFTHTTSPTRLCVAAPSQFRLWDDFASVVETLVTASSALQYRPIDPDDPAYSSPMALALASADCDALLLSNLGRSDLPIALPDEKPILSFLTTPRLPAPVTSAPHDGLIVTDPSLRARALALGWDAARIRIAAWPVIELSPPTSDAVAIIAHTAHVELPKNLQELSSFGFMRDLIQQQLHANPLAMGDDPVAFVRRCARKVGLPESSMDLGVLIERMLMPCYQQNLARLLARSGVKLQIWGSGWADCEDLAPCYAGDITTRRQLLSALSQCRLLVEDWPMPFPTALHRTARPVIRPAGKTRDEILRQLARPPAATYSTPPLTEAILLDLLR